MGGAAGRGLGAARESIKVRQPLQPIKVEKVISGGKNFPDLRDNVSDSLDISREIAKISVV